MKYLGLLLAVIALPLMAYGLYLGLFQQLWYPDALVPIGIAFVIAIVAGGLIILGDRMSP